MIKLGKFRLSDLLTADFKPHKKSSTEGIGQDAAVVRYSDAYTLTNTALLIEGVHFDLVYCPLQHVGYKAVVASLTDIVAMNGVAEKIKLHVAVSSKFTLEALQDLYSGIHTACKQYTLDLVGNEVTTTAQGLVMAVTTMGQGAPGKLCFREGAKPYDLICATGNLGAAYLGLQILIREKKIFEADPTMKPQLAPYQYLIGRQLKPTARVDITKLLDELQVVPSTMIHIKDGLAPALLHISKQSGVGMTIYEQKLPIDQQTYEVAEMFQLTSTICALHGGDDYELLFTLPQANWPQIEHNPLIHAIGYVTALSDGVKLITNGNTIVNITAPGWEESSEEDEITGD